MGLCSCAGTSCWVGGGVANSACKAVDPDPEIIDENNKEITGLQ